MKSKSLPEVMQPALDWFAACNWQPFPFQVETWRAYLAGRSGVINAPTGLGKTNAAIIGPLLEERLYALAPASKKPRLAADGPRVVWITPLRALASDTCEALTSACFGLKVPWSIEMRTGDTPSHLKSRQREKLPHVLITTPESMSVLLSYEESQEHLHSIRCIVVDEWHELLGSKRGVQTELVLARLRRLSPGARTWGVSATLGNLEQSLTVLLGERENRGVLIPCSIEKPLQIETLIPPDMERFPWVGHLGLRLLPQVLEALEKASTTLLFTNVRSQAEIWFHAIRQQRPDWSIGLHHGSLSREVREDVENELRVGTVKCVVCTSSLDLGVDFPAVDQVIQVGSPKGVARLIQRAGRSGHSPGRTSQILCVPTHAFELLEFAAVREAADLVKAGGAKARGKLESRIPLDRPLDVLVQQMVTTALGGGFEPEDYLEEVRSTYAYRNLTDDEWQWCLDFVTRGGSALRAYPQYQRVSIQDGRYKVTSRMIEKFHRLSIGTITSDSSVSVRMMGGGSLGSVEESFIAKLQPGSTFVFAGQVLEIIRVREMSVFVRKAKRNSGAIPTWMGGRLPLSSELADSVRRKLQQAESNDRKIWKMPEMDILRPILELQGRWSQIPRTTELLVEDIGTDDGHHLFVYPFEGRLVHEGLGALLAYRIAQQSPRSVAVYQNDYGIELISPQPITQTEEQWRELLRSGNLLDDLLACLNSTEMARRQFREIARVAGLVFSGYPGQSKTARQVQASSSLLFDVFLRYDPDNLLVEQARREVLERQLEASRLAQALARIATLNITIIHPERLTPFAFPIWADFNHNEVSTERWTQRVQRMLTKLEQEADKEQPARRTRRAA